MPSLESRLQGAYESPLWSLFSSLMDFRSILMSYLAPSDISSFCYGFMLSLSKAEKKRYLNPLREMDHYQDWLSRRIKEGFLVVMLGPMVRKVMDRIYRPDLFWRSHTSTATFEVYFIVTPTNAYAKSTLNWIMYGSWNGRSVLHPSAKDPTAAADVEWPLWNSRWRQDTFVCPFGDFKSVFPDYELRCRPNEPDYWVKNPITTESRLDISFYVGCGHRQTNTGPVQDRRVFLNARQLKKGVDVRKRAPEESLVDAIPLSTFLTELTMNFVELHADYQMTQHCVQTVDRWDVHRPRLTLQHPRAYGMPADDSDDYEFLESNPFEKDYVNTTICFWTKWGELLITFSRGRTGEWAKGIAMHMSAEEELDSVILPDYMRDYEIDVEQVSDSEDDESHDQVSDSESERSTDRDCCSENGASVIRDHSSEDGDR
ncbi:hypothetical protein CKM354_000004500 [Cercospora kikuchii]|uniref:Uncharacterized protein n=1 Tax=Cercospora kikuchii TaxID=84275 RepID=A0A9P3CA26_9PEZI|nr:uncharacterized protein CKM354_000004500 [Cercospora kikuchii]GIZ36575.1 hypothetical protein CKM354_000004500 [Cercospora kikuchii]